MAFNIISPSLRRPHFFILLSNLPNTFLPRVVAILRCVIVLYVLLRIR